MTGEALEGFLEAGPSDIGLNGVSGLLQGARGSCFLRLSEITDLDSHPILLFFFFLNISYFCKQFQGMCLIRHLTSVQKMRIRFHSELTWLS